MPASKRRKVDEDASSDDDDWDDNMADMLDAQFWDSKFKQHFSTALKWSKLLFKICTK